MTKLQKYYLNKIVWYLFTFMAALALNFFLPRMIDGNPVAVIANKMTEGMSDSTAIKKVYDTFNAEFGLDKPMWQQFLIYLQNLLKGDLGTSFSNYPMKVNDLLATYIPWTVALQIPSILIGWILGNLLGALVAYKKGIYQTVLFPISMFLNSVPPYILSVVLLYFFSIVLGILPTGGGYAFNMIPNMSPQFVGSVVKHYILPSASIVLATIGGQAIGMRSMTIYELNTDYVLYSKLMGVRDSKVVKYVFKNAMLPQITGLALSLGTMIGGSLISEMVFSYPGIGQLLLKGIGQLDYPLISGCTLMITVTVLFANLILDIVFGLVDPRIRAQQIEEGK